MINYRAIFFIEKNIGEPQRMELDNTKNRKLLIKTFQYFKKIRDTEQPLVTNTRTLEQRQLSFCSVHKCNAPADHIHFWDNS